MWWPLLSGHMVVYTSLYALEKNEQALLAQLWKSPKTESWLFAYINGTLKPILNNLRKLEPSLLDDSHLWDAFSPFQVTNRPATKTSHHTITVYQRSLPSQKSRTHRTLFWVMRLHFIFFFFLPHSTGDFKNPILSHPRTVINIFSDNVNKIDCLQFWILLCTWKQYNLF